jgi:hypothetical protein
MIPDRPDAPEHVVPGVPAAGVGFGRIVALHTAHPLYTRLTVGESVPLLIF